MDVQLTARVLWRFRVLVATGFALAFILALLSFVRISVSPPALHYRTAEQWESLSTVLVTSRGFPWGSLTGQAGTDRATGARLGGVDPSRLRDLASLYLELATSDGVMRTLARSGPIDGKVQAFAIFSEGGSNTLPLLTLSAVGPSPVAAHALGARYLHAFQAYLQRQQNAAETPSEHRVVIQPIRKPAASHLLAGRRKTKPIMIFLAVMVATLGLAFILENLRPRIRAVSAGQPIDQASSEAASRRIA